MTTSQKRAAVAAFEEVGVSERKACIAVGLSRATLRHKSTKKDDSALRNLIIEIAHARKRFGYELTPPPKLKPSQVRDLSMTLRQFSTSN